MSLSPSERLRLYEMAEDTIHFLVANCSAQLAEEESRLHSDRTRIEQIRAQRRQLLSIGRSLDHDNQAMLEEVIATYGPQLREARAAERRP